VPQCTPHRSRHPNDSAGQLCSTHRPAHLSYPHWLNSSAAPAEAAAARNVYSLEVLLVADLDLPNDGLQVPSVSFQLRFAVPLALLLQLQGHLPLRPRGRGLGLVLKQQVLDALLVDLHGDNRMRRDRGSGRGCTGMRALGKWNADKSGGTLWRQSAQSITSSVPATHLDLDAFALAEVLAFTLLSTQVSLHLLQVTLCGDPQLVHALLQATDSKPTQARGSSKRHRRVGFSRGQRQRIHSKPKTMRPADTSRRWRARVGQQGKARAKAVQGQPCRSLHRRAGVSCSMLRRKHGGTAGKLEGASSGTERCIRKHFA